MKYHKCVNFLISIGAQSIPHSGKTFMDHCINVYNFLRKGDCSDDVCYAGLMHSIYGNDIFSVDFKIEREQIKNLIGEKAESIVYHFNNTPRDVLMNENNHDITDILVANELDNSPLFQVIDNIFDDNNRDKLYGEFRDFKPWRFLGAGSNINKDRKFNYILNKKNKIDKILFEQADKIIEDNNLKKYLTLKKAYASGYTHGTIHELHRDYTSNGFNEVFTLMFYLNKEWNVSFGGETVFYYPETESITSILPRPGRAILFDGSILHLARDPSRICAELRMVATFQYVVGK